MKVTERVGGIKTVIEYARKFGITAPLPAFLPVALGRCRYHAVGADRGVHHVSQ